MKRALITLSVFLAVQIVFVGIYLAIERGRAPGHRPAEGPSSPSVVLEHESLYPAPELRFESVDGRVEALRNLRGRPVLLHVWATWCPPCRDELPVLLEYARSAPVPVIALSVDASWDVIEVFLGREPPAFVVRAVDEAAAGRLDVRSLPQTLLIDADGVIRRRLVGARDWRSAEVRADLEEWWDHGAGRRTQPTVRSSPDSSYSTTGPGR